MLGKPYPLLARGDLNGFWALFADNLANLVLIATVCSYVFDYDLPAVWGYGLMALLFAATHKFCRGAPSERYDE